MYTEEQKLELDLWISIYGKDLFSREDYMGFVYDVLESTENYDVVAVSFNAALYQVNKYYTLFEQFEFFHAQNRNDGEIEEHLEEVRYFIIDRIKAEGERFLDLQVQVKEIISNNLPHLINWAILHNTDDVDAEDYYLISQEII